MTARIYAVFLALLFLVALRPLQGYDTWFHLLNGRAIAESGAIPHHDLFLFTTAEFPFYWVNYEWLFGIFIWKFYEAGGAMLLCFLQAVIIAATFGLFILYNARMRVPPWLNLCVTWFAFCIAEFRFELRPFLITGLFYVMVLNLAVAETPRRWRVLTPLIFLAWPNVHIEFSIGLFMLMLILAGDTFDRWRKRDRREVTFNAILFAVSALATLCNASGPWLYAYVLGHQARTDMIFQIEELKRPPADWLWSVNGLFLACAWLALALAVHARRSRTRDVLLLLLVTALSFTMVRFRFNLALIGGCVMATSAAAAMVGARVPRLLKLGATIATLGLVLSRIFAAGVPQLGFDPNYNARRLVDFVLAEQPKPRIFNPFHWGDYIAFRTYPERVAFIDGMDQTYPDALLDTYREIMLDPKRLEPFKVNAVLMPFREEEGDEWDRFLAALDPKLWRPVFWNVQGIVYFRAGDPALKRFAYPTLNPVPLERNDLGALQALSPAAAAALEREFQSSLRHDPQNVISLLWLSRLYAGRGNLEGARTTLERAIAIDPEYPPLYLQLAPIYYAQGNLEAADRTLDKYLTYRLNSHVALFNKALIAVRRGNNAAAADLLRRVIRLKPDFTPAQELLGRVGG